MTEKKYFGTDGIRGRVGDSPTITPEFMLKLGWAFGQVINHPTKKVLIGKDTRLSGYMLESALQAGLIASGIEVVQLGPMPTPAISFLTKHLNMAGGIVISASHNPYHDNGIKLFDANGFKLPDGLELQIESLIDSPLQMVSSDKVGRAYRMHDAANLYQDYCKQIFPKLDLSQMRLTVDCAHGAMYQIAPQLLQSLGATIDCLGCKPDGLNINDQVGSTHPQALIEQVKQNGTIGVAFDGDGDRALLVDENGELVDGDDILYIIAKAKQQSQSLQGGVVGTLMSNFGIERAFKQLNIPFVRAQVGDRYVLEALQDKGWSIGGETSGHFIDLSKANTGDGLMAALSVLEQVQLSGKKLYELKQGLTKCTQTLINVPAKSGKTLVASPAIQSALKANEAKLNGHGRIVLRPSGTEPLVRVMVEADEANMTKQVASEIAETVKQMAVSA